MPRLPASLRLLFAAALALALAPAASAQQRGRAGDFDLYVLSLSWSPTYCMLKARGDGGMQCRDANHAFVVHGLWPQYERGYPQDCGREFDRLPARLVNSMLDLMPAPGLIQHQWRKHGTCSGLSPQAYFDIVRRVATSIKMPEGLARTRQDQELSADEVMKAFSSANPGLTRDMMSVTCTQGHLEEVRICMSRTLQPRRCPQTGNASCRSGPVTIPAARSGYRSEPLSGSRWR
jgi:ribonuclease T2